MTVTPFGSVKISRVLRPSTTAGSAVAANAGAPAPWGAPQPPKSGPTLSAAQTIETTLTRPAEPTRCTGAPVRERPRTDENDADQPDTPCPRRYMLETWRGPATTCGRAHGVWSMTAA